MSKAESSALEVLRTHLELCSELHALLLEENKVVRVSGTPPPEALLARKRDFLPRLDASLERLRQLNATRTRFSAEEESAVQEGRKRLMQLLMLDRENERLLLKASLPPQLKAAYAPALPGQVARAYQRHAAPVRRDDDAPPSRSEQA